ncbi:MAG: DNA-processing protein DprA [Bacillota bacterium]|nr:DNA-processing protein DprA [Bacillota bacterium]
MIDAVEAKYLISLNQIEGMDQKYITVLMDSFSSAEAAWRKESRWRKLLPLSAGRVESLLAAKKNVNPEKLWAYAQKLGVKIASVKDDDYPDVFREIYDVPYFIYYLGTLPAQNAFAFTVVGSRKCSQEGSSIAKLIVKRLVECGHATIVGGLAEGIDSAAHWAALNAGGETVAVLGCGIDVIYPTSNTKLYMKIKEKGCILTDYSFGAAALKHHFPRRNRLMSALGKGVVVIEGTRGSGVFHTVAHGLDQGKEIYAVPGSILESKSYASNFLLREGTAKLITCADDILEDFMELEQRQEIVTTDMMDFSRYLPAERSALEALKEGPMPFDMIERISGLPSSKLAALLTQWELEEIVSQRPGRVFALCNRVQEVSHE